MVSDPRAKTIDPAHAVLAVVLQVRDGQPPGAALGARARAVPRQLVAAGRRRSPRARRSSSRSAATSRRRSTSASSPTSSSSRRAASPAATRCAGSSRPPTSASSRATSTPSFPDDTRWHPVDELPQLAFDHEPIVLAGRERLRAKLSYTNVGFALAPDDVHDLRAARPLPRRARPRRLGDEPPARAAAPAPARADRQPPRARPGRRPPGGALRLRAPRARDHRPVRGPATAGLGLARA